MISNQSKIRNIAVIAHVDHGKTTLVDAFLKQSNIFRENQEEMQMQMILDTGELEREKGITIKAKNVSIDYGEYLINIIDTPGHADFGGEVERTLNMADGCLLIVDAAEGPMPQTTFVLKKALELALKPIVVINKIDKTAANIAWIESKVQDLFLNLASDESQLDFPVFYAVGKQGKVWENQPDDIAEPADIRPLLNKIIDYVPAPFGNPNDPFQMQITTLDFDAHVGRYLIGKINRGKVNLGDSVVVTLPDKSNKATNIIDASGSVKKILIKKGMGFTEVSDASVGQLVAIIGIDSKAIGGTICAKDHIDPLPVIKISDPSVRIKIESNTSPFLGKDGEFVTAKQLQARLEKEADQNISLQIEKNVDGSFYVSGRGDLQLTILIEELRREGFELQVRQPEVIIKKIDGVNHEPLEDLYIEVPEEYSGTVLNEVNSRHGELISMHTENSQTTMQYKILTANLLGLRNNLLVETKGNIVMNNYLDKYVPLTEHEDFFRRGAIISTHTGSAAAYALNSIQERGELFIEPATEVYEGMIIGVNKYEQDLEVNPTKERQKSGVRRNQAEVTQVQLKGIKKLTLEFALLFLAKDEILEVTPKNLRLRKRYLKSHEREWSKRDNLTDYAKQQLGI